MKKMSYGCFEGCHRLEGQRYRRACSAVLHYIIFKGISQESQKIPIIPDFHTSVEIISKNRTGLGVQFINKSAFGGYKMESIYEVTEYRFNEYIKMENKSQYGLTELIVEDIGNNETIYTLINYVRIPSSMKNKLYSAFDKELETIKRISENNFNN